MRSWLMSSIRRKMTSAILLVSLVPLALSGYLALRGFARGGEAAIARSSAALDDKSADALEVRALEVARSIDHFLREREADLRSLALIPPTERAYRRFLQTHRGEIWYEEEGREVVESLPLYLKVAYLDLLGRELVAASADLENPHLLLAGDVGSYLTPTLALPPGEIYVSHVVGDYVSAADFAAGKRFAGALRFAMVDFDAQGEPQGIVTLVLDSRHLEEFTAHVVPTAERAVVAPDPSTGNYAYIIDDRGYVIAHPSDDIVVGVGEDGEIVPYATEEEDLGTHPVRMDQLGFYNANLAEIHRLASQGLSGSLPYNWRGKDKIVAYAPIPYEGGSYDLPRGFGWVGIGTDVAHFHEAAVLVGGAIDDETVRLTRDMVILLLLTSVGVVITTTLLARNLSGPICRLTEAARAMEMGEISSEEVEELQATQGQDEVAQLSRVFASMAREVQARARRLGAEVERLRVQIDEAKRRREVENITETDYFQQLKARAREMRRQQ